MLCVYVNEFGELRSVNPQPVDVSTCALVIPSSEVNNFPFLLSSDDGLAIATAIVSVWCVGFAFRALISILKFYERSYDE